MAPTPPSSPSLPTSQESATPNNTVLHVDLNRSDSFGLSPGNSNSSSSESVDLSPYMHSGSSNGPSNGSSSVGVSGVKPESTEETSMLSRRNYERCR
jgi:hypothetical protein